jgi:IS5 family transposase
MLAVQVAFCYHQQTGFGIGVELTSFREKPMRQFFNPQRQLGDCDIAAIELDPRSRDDIPRLLRGLQYIYMTDPVRKQIEAILAEVLPQRSDGSGAVSSETGRPGMDQWQILVLGTLRLGLNADYDRIQELANQHTTIRQMLRCSDWDEPERFHLQTIKDNLRLFTPDVLDRINQVVVNAGHALVKKSLLDGLEVRCDSSVVETHVHYPTDINLLYDAVRKSIETVAKLCDEVAISDWRQSAYNVRCLKKAYRRLQRLKHSRSKNEDKRKARDAEIEQACRDYLDVAGSFLGRVWVTRELLRQVHKLPEVVLRELDCYVAHGERQRDQVRRRVLEGERIPHAEKVFSIFQEHTEWINKGKAGVPVELGLRVVIVEDQYRFVLHHRVMQHETDDQIAVVVIEETVQRFPSVISASMDKGFHSRANQEALPNVVAFPVLPKKGKCSAEEAAYESHPRFVRLRRSHSAVESAINALEVHGLDLCRDHGIDGFERYVAMAVVARNIHRIGAILIARDAEEEQRRRKRAA